MRTLAVILLLCCASGPGFAAQQLASAPVPDKYLQHPLGPLEQDKNLHLAIQLPVRDGQAQDKFLQDLNDPKSPDYKHYLTPQQYADRFAPTAADYNAIVSFFKSKGFEVTVSPGRMLLDIDGSVNLVESTFHTSIQRYRDPQSNEEFYAPAQTPSIDLSQPLTVVGLDNFRKMRPLK